MKIGIQGIYPSESDDALLSVMLTDEALQAAESMNPGAIRLLLVTRNRARISVYLEILQFEIVDFDGKKKLALISRTNYADDNLLISLAWHRAAEAIAAVRRGHFEHVLQQRARNTKKGRDA